MFSAAQDLEEGHEAMADNQAYYSWVHVQKHRQ